MCDMELMDPLRLVPAPTCERLRLPRGSQQLDEPQTRDPGLLHLRPRNPGCGRGCVKRPDEVERPQPRQPKHLALLLAGDAGRDGEADEDERGTAPEMNRQEAPRRRKRLSNRGDQDDELRGQAEGRSADERSCVGSTREIHDEPFPGSGRARAGAPPRAAPVTARSARDGEEEPIFKRKVPVRNSALAREVRAWVPARARSCRGKRAIERAVRRVQPLRTGASRTRAVGPYPIGMSIAPSSGRCHFEWQSRSGSNLRRVALSRRGTRAEHAEPTVTKPNGTAAPFDCP